MSPDVVNILDGNTFVVSDERGDVEATPTDTAGLFSFDTRFLSTWVLTVNGERLNALSTDDLSYFRARFFLVPGTGTVYVDSKLSVIRERAVSEGFHETLTVLNHDEKPIDLTLRIEAGSDFADLFEVKDALDKKGEYRQDVEKGRLVLTYRRETFERATAIESSPAADIDPSGLTFRIRVDPHDSWTAQLAVVTRLVVSGQVRRTPGSERALRRARSGMEADLRRWISSAPRLELSLIHI